MTDSYVWDDWFHIGICTDVFEERIRLMGRIYVTQSYFWHVSFICAMTHSYVCYDWFVCVRRLVLRLVSYLHMYWCIWRAHAPDGTHICDSHVSDLWHDSFMCVTWLIHVCDMTHSYLWHDSFKSMTWLICHYQEWVMSHIRVSHVAHMNMSFYTYEYVMSHMNMSCHTYEWVMSHIEMSHITHMNV